MAIKEQAVTAARRSLPEGQQLHRASSPLAFLRRLAHAGFEDSFHVVDIGRLADRYAFWQQLFPRITPYYAVKANPDPVIVQTLAALGSSFDCASEAEMRQIIATETPPERILFAHPRKPVSSIEYAKEVGLRRMTFDSADELEKMLEHYPEGEYVLRIKTDDLHSSVPLSSKFGATMDTARKLLRLAHERHAEVIGVSFHVGSNCDDPESYRKPLQDAALLFKEAAELHGIKLRLLDVGGGWPGTNDELCQRMAKVVNEVVTELFDPSVEVIGEPGRFMSAQVVHIATRIIGADRIEDVRGDGEAQFSYFLSDGVYGSFLDSLYYQYDTRLIRAEGIDLLPLDPTVSEKLYRCTLWGPTCDSGDKVFENVMMPAMKRGDYLYSAGVGAYCNAMRTSFNGIRQSQAFYFFCDDSEIPNSTNDY